MGTSWTNRVLGAHPMDDVMNSMLIKWTVTEGVIYDASTLDVIQH
jgi:hypothetical protein